MRVIVGPRVMRGEKRFLDWRGGIRVLGFEPRFLRPERSVLPVRRLPKDDPGVEPGFRGGYKPPSDHRPDRRPNGSCRNRTYAILVKSQALFRLS